MTAAKIAEGSLVEKKTQVSKLLYDRYPWKHAIDPPMPKTVAIY